MPDDTTNTHGSDHHRVSLSERDELRYWGDRFGVSHQLLKQAVDAVGTRALRVEEWLQQHR
ncbi:DUF3606 domain-containing protein [Roseateles sp. SL47]|uniref:DUF3606 domain-containing protein n=1 Tax=Roseateles sp. SL47 TaxID=2995138 RepID=UPI00226E10D7|nr:DUF3606 domain-containing protein [Roseateles sp. SL47]WAC71360.1 DUF3606 domain-containing protein [Roseateles sp. SL47]